MSGFAMGVGSFGRYCRTSCLASLSGAPGGRPRPTQSQTPFSLPQFLAQNAFGRCANIPDPGPRICPNTYGRHIAYLQSFRLVSETTTNYWREKNGDFLRIYHNQPHTFASAHTFHTFSSHMTPTTLPNSPNGEWRTI